ncbi:hypothetical protein DKX38_008453 [Salix brachista]|uniref:Dof zinc finger protein n=1 Tax=Salix brachista TaxID=2182728 RepID=A0A5N5MR22_9ROSI|nr:hypothetical protein DKX38_008453 [Salix brachista]
METTHHPAKTTEPLPCPRCNSTTTKFCYYNNYNLSQPRHFCKSCRRYWTQGGTLRDVPVGGGTRKNSKRSRSTSDNSPSMSTSSSNSTSSNSAPLTAFTTTHEPESMPVVLPSTTDSGLAGMKTEIIGPATIGLKAFSGKKTGVEGLVEAGMTKKSQGFLSIHQRMCKIHHPSRQHRIHGNRDSVVRLLPNLDQVACVFYPSTATYNSKPNGPIYRETNIAEYMAYGRSRALDGSSNPFHLKIA